jgi:competence protein ComEA
VQKNMGYFLSLFFVFGFIAGFLLSYYRNEISGGETVVSAASIEGLEEKIVVDLGGAVKKPGLYTLPKGSRVGELIKIGGGISNDSSNKWASKNLNLSKILEDSEKVYIPFSWEIYNDEGSEIISIIPSKTAPPSSQSGSNDSSKIDVNKATTEELDKLSGIGPVYAGKIILGRPYASFDDLVKKSGVPASTLQKIKDSVKF